MSRTLAGPPRRRTPAALSALALMALAVLVGWAALEQLLTRRWPDFAGRTLDGLQHTAWATAAGWGAGAGLTILGLVLIGAAVTPGRARHVGLASPSSPQVREASAFLTAAGLARLAAARVQGLDGVDRVVISCGRRRLRARIRTSLTDTAALRSAVREVLSEQVGAVGITPPPKIIIRTSHQPVRS